MNKYLLFLLMILLSFNCFSLSLSCDDCASYDMVYGSKHTLQFQLNETTNLVNLAECTAITKIGDKIVSIYEGTTSKGLFTIDVDTNDWVYDYGADDYMSKNVTTLAYCECFNGSCVYEDGSITSTYNYSELEVEFTPTTDKFRYDVDYFSIFFALALIAGIFAWIYSKMDMEDHAMYKIVVIFINQAILLITLFLMSSLLYTQTKLQIFENMSDVFMYLFYFIVLFSGLYWVYYGFNWLIQKYFGDDED